MCSSINCPSPFGNINDYYTARSDFCYAQKKCFDILYFQITNPKMLRLFKTDLKASFGLVHQSVKILSSGGNVLNRNFASAQAQAQPLPVLDPEWETAKPFEALPKQTFFTREFLPGGALSGKTFPEMFEYFQKKHGNIVIMPGIFRRPSIVVTFDPNDWEKVYRTEGPWPYRLGLESLSYWRRQVRKDIFHDFFGLVDE